MTDLVQERPRLRPTRFILETAFVVVFALLIWNNYTMRRHASGHAAASMIPHRGFVPKDRIATLPTVDLTGRAGTLDLRNGRTLVAVVDPRCESCRELIATMRETPGARVLSVAPLDETRTMAKQAALLAPIAMVGTGVPKSIAPQLEIYPQLFVVDRGVVVRTCATVEECR
jgi:hypothetical protein